MSKIYHIKPKDNRKKQKEPLWKYILVIAIVIFFLMIRDHRIDLSGLYNFILSTKGILNRWKNDADESNYQVSLLKMIQKDIES